MLHASLCPLPFCSTKANADDNVDAGDMDDPDNCAAEDNDTPDEDDDDQPAPNCHQVHPTAKAICALKQLSAF